MSWRDQLKGDPLPWLLEPADPGARYLALRDLDDRPANDAELLAARKLAHQRGPIEAVLKGMRAEGYWVEPGAGYNPKYTSTVWAIILLGQLGADAACDERIPRACAYLLDHALTPAGQFSSGGPGAPSGTVDCLHGNLLAALMAMGYADPRLQAAYDWMARSVTGEGIAPAGKKDEPRRWYAGKCGPRFACGANDKQPCAWGAVKVMLAFARCPAAWRTPLVDRAIAEGIDFLLSVDPATAAYPSGWTGKPSGSWWKFGFPVFYVTDILQIAEALAALGHARDARLANTRQLIRDKQDAQGRWALEYDYAGKTWGDYGTRKQPNKWVTIRALRVLKAAAE